MPHSIYTELYWLCEELMSYTDLTGSRFDREDAQRRLLPMSPLLQKLGKEAWLAVYEQLSEQLEGLDFDKKLFGDTLRTWFEEVEVARGNGGQ